MAGSVPSGPVVLNIPWLPVRSLASSMTRWPWSSASALRTLASGPGGRPWTAAVMVRSRMSRSTSASMNSRAARWRSEGSVIPPWRRARSNRSAAVGPFPHNAPPLESDTRSLDKVTLARAQPCPSSPTRLAAGIRTSSRNTSLKVCRPVISMIGRMVMPGASIGQMKYETPRCLGTSGSVRAIRIPNRETWANDVQIFWPWTT
jgi:hypothetical protein